MEEITFCFSSQGPKGFDDWYRYEAVGRTDTGAGIAGWSLLCRELPAELAALAHGFESFHFASQSWWHPPTRQLTTKPSASDIELTGRTLYFVRRGVWEDSPLAALYQLGAPPRPASVSSPPPPTTHARAVTSEEILQLLTTRRCLVFTGAGISRAAGVPDFATFDFSDVFGLRGPLLNQFVKQIVTAPQTLLDLCQRTFAVNPTPAHLALRQIHDRYPFRLVSGNIDGLHEATGMCPTRQASDTEVQFSGLGDYEVLIGIGISHDGMGPVAQEFRRLRPDGIIIAIDMNTPAYLAPDDGLLQGDLQEILPAIAHRALHS
jgi:hypothetical protein